MIILFNNIEMNLKYMRKLKQALLNKYEELFRDEENKMIVSCIEELDVRNQARFQNLLKEKMK